MSSTVSASWPAPRTRRLSRAKVGLAIGLVAFGISWQVIGDNLSSIFSLQAAADAWEFLSRLFRPDLSPEFLCIGLKASGQALAAAVASAVLSIVLGVPLAVLAPANLWRRGILVEGVKR